MNQIEKYCKKIREFAIKNECLTCECLQGFISQLLMDFRKEDVSKLKKCLKDKRFVYSCLGCDPCPPGEFFAEYLKNKK